MSAHPLTQSAPQARPQSRTASALEAVVNVAVGYGLAVGLNLTVLPAFGVPISGGQAVGVALVFTAASLVRSYLLRRLFNRAKDYWSQE